MRVVGGNDDDVQYEDNDNNLTPSYASMELSSADEADNDNTIGSDDNYAISGVEASDSDHNNQQTTTTRVGVMMAMGDNNARGEGCRRRLRRSCRRL